MTDASEQELAFDIAFALRKALPRPKPGDPVDRAAIAATRVVAHLKLCRWTFERLPPAPGHSTHGARGA